MSALSYSSHKKLFPLVTHYGQAPPPHLHSLKEGRGVQVSLGPSGSPSLLSRNHPHVRIAHPGEASSETLHCHFLLFFCLAFDLKKSNTTSTTTIWTFLSSKCCLKQKSTCRPFLKKIESFWLVFLVFQVSCIMFPHCGAVIFVRNLYLVLVPYSVEPLKPLEFPKWQEQ